MATDAVTSTELLQRAEAARLRGDGDEAIASYERAVDLGEADGDLEVQTAAVLGLARCQEYNLTPGLLPVRLHAVYTRAREPGQRVRLAAALARCWSYAGEPLRARPFADEALALADDDKGPAGVQSSGTTLLADALDAALTTYWGPDDLDRRRELARRLADATAHLRDPDARLQAHLWGLTVAWEALDVPRMDHEMRAIEVLGQESAKARFFAGSRRLALDLLRGRTDTMPTLREAVEQASREVLVPDAFAVLHAMTAYSALFSGDVATCTEEAELYEAYAIDEGVVVVRAEAAMIWMGAGRADRIRDVIGVFTAEVLTALPRDSDWLLTLQCVLEAAVSVGDRQVVTDVVALLRHYEGRSVVNAGAVMFHGVTDDPLSRGYALLGDSRSAERLRASALATYERIGATWWRDRLRASGERLVRQTDIGPARVAHLHGQPGGLWSVGTEGSRQSLPPLRGLGYLHTLVSTPDVDVAALDLVGARTGSVVVEPSLGEVLDDRARREYRNRLTDLEQEIAEAEEWSDQGRLQELAAEREALLKELDAAAGLGGRVRRGGSSQEKARTAVRKAIVFAIARVAEVDPWLGRHLRDRVHTGTVCRYEADPDLELRWVLDG